MRDVEAAAADEDLAAPGDVERLRLRLLRRGGDRDLDREGDRDRDLDLEEDRREGDRPVRAGDGLRELGRRPGEEERERRA